MKTLAELGLISLCENAAKYSDTSIRELPVLLLHQLLAYLSASQLHRLDGVLRAAGVSTEPAWRTHLRKRWPHAGLRAAPVFGEDDTSTDPHQKYLEKHCHDLLHCRFFVQHQHTDPRGYFNTCLYRLNHSECRLPDAAPGQLDHNDLYVYARYMRRVTIRAVQCSAMLTDARLLAVWRTSVHCLNIHWVRDEYFCHLVALVAQLLQHGSLDTLVLFHFRLSSSHIGQLFQLCAGHGPRCRLKCGASTAGLRPNGPVAGPGPDGPVAGPSCSGGPTSDHVLNSRINPGYRSRSVNVVNVTTQHTNGEYSILNNEQTDHVTTEQTDHVTTEQTDHVTTEQTDHVTTEQTDHVISGQTGRVSRDDEVVDVNREQTEHVNIGQTEHMDIGQHGRIDVGLTGTVNRGQIEQINAERTGHVIQEQTEHVNGEDEIEHTHQGERTVPQGRSLRESANLALQGLISQNAPQPSEHTPLHSLHQMSDFDIDTDTDDLFDAAVLPTSSGGILPLPWGLSTEGVDPLVQCKTRALGSLGIITSPHCSQLINILVDALPRWQHLHRLALYSAFVGTDQFQEIILQKLDSSQLSELVMVDCIFSKSRILLDTLQVLINSDRQKPIQHLLMNNNVETISTYADPMSFDIDGGTVDFLGVVELDLSDNRMDDACVAVLARLLRHDIALRHLKLDTCQMREGRLLHILRSMPDGGRLERLSLAEIIFSRETNLTEATEDELVCVLQKTRTLKCLNVQGCHLSARLVTSPAFIESIRQHPSLVELNVADNHLGVSGCDFLTGLLLDTPRPLTLTTLNLGYNGIRGESLLQAARCIVGSIARGEPTSRLRKLTLSGNRMGTVHHQVELQFGRFVDDLEGNDLDHVGAAAEHIAMM